MAVIEIDVLTILLSGACFGVIGFRVGIAVGLRAGARATADALRFIERYWNSGIAFRDALDQLDLAAHTGTMNDPITKEQTD